MYFPYPTAVPLPMKPRSLPMLLVIALTLATPPWGLAETPSWAREVIHFKMDPRTKKEVRTGSTESQSDPAKNMLIQLTRNAQGVEITRREFILDSQGRIRSGAVRDGQGRLSARTQYGFDSYDRINEERLFDASGRCIRRLLFKYDATSRRLVDKVYMWNRNDPYGPLVESAPSAEDAAPILPVQRGDKELPGVGLPQFRGDAAPPAGTTPSTAPAKPEKKGLFDWLKRGKK
jgi:hypothetical protein